MSYELKIDPKSRAAGRFIGHVRKTLTSAAMDGKKETGITQQQIASRLGINRSVINRLLRGEANLTLRSVAEIAWALGWEPVFTLRRRVKQSDDHNHFVPIEIDRPAIRATASSRTNNAVLSPTTATTRMNVLELAD